MALAGASRQLDNGLAVKAISDPAAASAAALVRIEAGSFQAPTARPGASAGAYVVSRQRELQRAR